MKRMFWNAGVVGVVPHTASGTKLKRVSLALAPARIPVVGMVGSMIKAPLVQGQGGVGCLGKSQAWKVSRLNGTITVRTRNGLSSSVPLTYGMPKRIDP